MEYDVLTIIKLVVASLLPVVLSAAFYCAERKMKFGKANYWVRQAVISAFFGGLPCLPWHSVFRVRKPC